GVDIAMMLVFGLVVAAAARAIVKDGESFTALSPEPPPVADGNDEASQRALEGADARSIPTLDGMRGLAVLSVLLFHFAWTFPGEDLEAAATFTDEIAARVHALFWSGWTGVDLFFV